MLFIKKKISDATREDNKEASYKLKKILLILIFFEGVEWFLGVKLSSYGVKLSSYGKSKNCMFEFYKVSRYVRTMADPETDNRGVEINEITNIFVLLE